MKAHAVAVVAVVAFGALLAAGCSTVTPLPITGADVCFNCRRPINDPSLAGEVITQSHQALKFKTIACMTRFLKANPETAKVVYVTDYTTRRLIRATTATFVPFVMVEGYEKTPDYIAYYTAEGAAAAAKEHNGTPMKWAQVLERAE